MDFLDLKNKAKDVASGVKENAQSAALDKGLISDEDVEKMDEATDIGSDKIKSILEEISDSSNILKEAGYELDGISVTLGLPPKITVHLLYDKDIPEDKEKELLERTKDRKLIQVLLKALFKAASMESEVNKLDFKIVSVDVQVGLIPSVVLNFSKK